VGSVSACPVEIITSITFPLAFSVDSNSGGHFCFD